MAVDKVSAEPSTCTDGKKECSVEDIGPSARRDDAHGLEVQKKADVGKEESGQHGSHVHPCGFHRSVVRNFRKFHQSCGDGHKGDQAADGEHGGCKFPSKNTRV